MPRIPNELTIIIVTKWEISSGYLASKISNRRRKSVIRKGPTMTNFSAIGQRTPLLEGKAKVTGKTRYLSDLQVPGMLCARLVTSLHAHARIVSVDASRALAI